MPHSSSRPARLLVAALVLAGGLAGCGYSIRPPYSQTIRTVYLPMFKSNRFRRDLQQRMTELVKDEIQRRTPFKVVNDPEGADARLEGTIILDDKAVAVESPVNLPRHILALEMVSVKFVDNRMPYEKSRLITPALVIEAAPFYPEIGETANMGFEKSMRAIAREIVSMMEEGWGEEYERRQVEDAERQAETNRDRADFDRRRATAAAQPDRAIR